MNDYKALIGTGAPDPLGEEACDPFLELDKFLDDDDNDDEMPRGPACTDLASVSPGLPAPVLPVPLGELQYTRKAKVDNSIYWVAGPALTKSRPPSVVPQAKAPGPIGPQIFRGTRAQHFRDMASSSRFVRSHDIPGHVLDSVAASLSSVPAVSPSGLSGHYVYHHIEIDQDNEIIDLERDEF